MGDRVRRHCQLNGRYLDPTVLRPVEVIEENLGKEVKETGTRTPVFE